MRKREERATEKNERKEWESKGERERDEERKTDRQNGKGEKHNRMKE